MFHVTIAPRGILQIDDAKICFRNFAGEPDKYNRAGDRNFALVIPDEETKNALIAEGYNVRTRPPRDPDDEPFMYLPVKIKFNDRGPYAYLVTNGKKVQLDEESINCLDKVYILKCDLDIRPYDWDVNGKTGRTAYLQSIRVYQQNLDRFAEEEYPGEEPF